MHKPFLPAITLLMATGWGQIIHRQGKPPGWNLAQAAGTVEPLFLPSIALDALEREDAETDVRKDQPYRFAVPHAVDWKPANSGTWTTLSNGDRLWRLEVQSPGAVNLNVIFDVFRLEPGEEVYLYSFDRASVLGPLTHLNNLPEGSLATMPIDGDHMVVEYLAPKGAAEGELAIGQVAHGYRRLGEVDFSSPGSCHNNVVCPEWKEWACHTRSVALLVQGGRTWCTATLLNNTAQDGRPLVLTANHCQPQNVPNWVFVFNWTSPTCNPTTNVPRNQSVSGGRLLVQNGASDFALLEMSSKPPASYEVYYSGWDATGRVPQNQVGIHHPSGSIMKISSDDNPARRSGNFWSVSWDDGVTEPGSSGSGLWDENQRLIGQLQGGASSCQNRTGWDSYGSLSASWGLGASQYLDPAGTGRRFMDGMGGTRSCGGNTVSASFSPDAATSCNGSVRFADKSVNARQWLWNFGDGTTSSVQHPFHAYAVAGTYKVTLVAMGDSGRADTVENRVRVAILGDVKVSGDSSCVGQSAQLKAAAPAGTQVSWFGQPAGDTPLAKGPSFTTPSLSGPVTYYVQVAEDMPIRKAGPSDNSIGGGGMYNTFDHGLFFEVHAPINLKSVKVFAGSAGSRIIEVRRGRDGEVVATATREIPPGESRVQLNFSLETGSYFIKVADGPLLDLFRNNSGPEYPYTLEGFVTITRSSADQPEGYYYFFYDWEVQEQGCASERIAVPMRLAPSCPTGIAAAGDLGGFSLFQTAESGIFTVTVFRPTEIRIHHPSGKLLHKASFQSGTNRLDLRNLSPGLYLAAFTGIAPRWVKVGL
jgi:hypothetical protein